MTNGIKQVIRQCSDSYEQRLVMHAALLLDIPIKTVKYESLDDLTEILSTGTVLPVGSVEYVRKAMALAGIPEPSNLSYPKELECYLGRKIYKTTIDDIPDKCFIKPETTKLFTGFVYDNKNIHLMDEDTLEQYTVFKSLPTNTNIWVGEIVSFLCEWRCYIENSKLIGLGRYDPYGEDNAPVPNHIIINNMIQLLQKRFNNKVTCAIDIGILENGDTALIEVNDAWAIGVYAKAIDARTYLSMLSSRWTTLHEDNLISSVTLG